MMNTLAIAFTYVGTIIGAGFASGQEIKKYFIDYGSFGLISFILAGLLLFFVGKKLVILGYENKARSYKQLIEKNFSFKTQHYFDYIIIFFLFGSFTTMVSGMGAFFMQSFSISAHVGSMLLIILSCIAVLTDIKAITKMNIVVVPVLIIATGMVAIKSMSNFNIIQPETVIEKTNIFFALNSGVIYALYNLIMSISVLPVLGNMAKSKDSITRGVLLGSILIIIFGLIIYCSLCLNYGIIKNVEVPIEVISNIAKGYFSIAYKISFTLAVFTTAVSLLYGIYSRTNKKIWILLLSAVGAYIGSLLGFSVLVTYLYSFMGYMGIIIITSILVKTGD